MIVAYWLNNVENVELLNTSSTYTLVYTCMSYGLYVRHVINIKSFWWLTATVNKSSICTQENYSGYFLHAPRTCTVNPACKYSQPSLIQHPRQPTLRSVYEKLCNSMSNRIASSQSTSFNRHPR